MVTINPKFNNSGSFASLHDCNRPNEDSVKEDTTTPPSDEGLP